MILKFLKSCILIFTLITYPPTGTTQLLAEEMRYKIEGNSLYFNMNIRMRDLPLELGMNRDDVEDMSLILMENEQIKTVVLTGLGGMGDAQKKLSEKIISFELNTSVMGRCSSACAQLFLAGKNRTVLSGGKLGFHSPYILKDEEERYYQHVKAKKGWRDEFDYVVYIYERSYEDAILDIEYMTSRGVSLEFALKALKVPANKIWYPTVNELLANGVIDAME